MILLSVIAKSRGYCALDNPFLLSPDSGSASYSQGPFAPFFNPAYNDVPGSSQFGYRYFSYREHSDIDSGNHYVMMKLLGFSLGYTRYNSFYDTNKNELLDANANLFSISKGLYINNMAGIGVEYSFSNRGDENYSGYRSWSFGFLLRPMKYLSMGALLRDAGAGIGNERMKRNEIYSLTLRPFTDRITLSADASRITGTKYSEMDYSYYLSFRAPYEISLTLKFDHDRNVLFGFQAPLYIRNDFMTRNLAIDAYASQYGKSRSNFTSIGISSPVETNKSAVAVNISDNLLLIKINRVINENPVKKLLKSSEFSFFEILTGIRTAAEDPLIDGIILQIDQAGLEFTQIQEIKDELAAFKSTGKKVYSILSTIGNLEYYLASLGDKIYFTPNSHFTLQGLSASVYFFKELMDSAGIKFESIRKGKFKSFNEPFVRQNMSPEFKENMQTLLADLNEQFIGDIMKDRKLERSAMDMLFNSGIMTPAEAKKNRFVDEIMYSSSAISDIGSSANIIKIEDYINEVDMNHTWGAFPEIAIVYLNGTITDGESKGSNYIDAMGDDTFREIMTEIFKNSNIKAVIIRINSGGGSASASDNMLNTLKELKKEHQKPVIFSFGTMAASGGYYIACTGDEIFSSRGTITGSIGVIFGKLSMKDLYKKLGISKEVIKMSEYADIFSESKDLNENERKLLQDGVDFMYSRFTDMVMGARKYKKEEIDSVSEGRVFSGNQARPIRLIDEIGGLSTAVEFARMKAGIEGEYKISEYPVKELPLTEFFSPLENSPLGRLMKKMSKNINIPMGQRNSGQYMIPYKIVIE